MFSDDWEENKLEENVWGVELADIVRLFFNKKRFTDGTLTVFYHIDDR